MYFHVFFIEYKTLLSKLKIPLYIRSTIVYSACEVGALITLPLAGYLSDGTFLDGWPAIFYLLGIVGCIWFIMWSLLFYETPEQHPYITRKELQYIKGQGNETIKSVC